MKHWTETCFQDMRSYYARSMPWKRGPRISDMGPMLARDWWGEDLRQVVNGITERAGAVGPNWRFKGANVTDVLVEDVLRDTGTDAHTVRFRKDIAEYMSACECVRVRGQKPYANPVLEPSSARSAC